jgi:hypothetical protein
MLNNLGDAYKGYKSLDLCFFLYDFNTGELVPIDAVIHDFGKVRLSSQVISLWFANPVTGDPNYFLCRLKNNETGEYIVQPSGSDFVVLLQEYGGANYIFSINGDAGGDLSVSTIYL